jgi:hypothetical protein
MSVISVGKIRSTGPGRRLATREPVDNLVRLAKCSRSYCPDRGSGYSDSNENALWTAKSVTPRKRPGSELKLGDAT